MAISLNTYSDLSNKFRQIFIGKSHSSLTFWLYRQSLSFCEIFTLAGYSTLIFVRYPPKLGEEDWFVYLMLQKTHIDINTMTFNDNIYSVGSYQPELLWGKTRSRSDGGHVILHHEEEGSEKCEGIRTSAQPNLRPSP